MSRIFKVSRGLTRLGKWLKPGPSFVGGIAIDDASVFCDYCGELYKGNMSEIDKDIKGNSQLLKQAQYCVDILANAG